MRIVATADLHGSFPEIPECDLLLIAGDVCPIDHPARLGKYHNPSLQRDWLRETFSPWLDEQPADHIVWIGGNHDFICEQPAFYRIAAEFPARYLKNETVEIGGKKIWGMPWTPNLKTWAFYVREAGWHGLGEMIPADTDILLMHAPPSGLMLDGGHPDWAAPFILTQISQRVQPELCVFGHIHEGYGTIELRGTTYANVAYMNEYYEPVGEPMVFEL